ncbi:hypothetical protein J5X98_15120 [Leptothermofonsia sichuanensis E412]|jgi:hypothetical protein|uniref:hypothetical protein n=1 Tax=Leptothermofonsia sichuanensis TaxID=2917832 RepID=UPI001CA68DAD|nr:hypothetical protein [Leptothermofonsia sichuanensis]QZZ18787.1 hypothetical protein J5X98_15120 [Leptothermofonsia sichuanensis E412]
MPPVQYRLFFNNTPATRDQLDKVEEITVEQEIDIIWEARLQIPICTDAQGRWSQQDERFLREFSRVRIEVQVGNGAFVPLIDGPIVGFENQMSGQPGQSIKVVRVNDDGVYLGREDQTVPHENRQDHQIAEQLLREVEQIASVEVDTTPAPTSSLPPFVMQQGTTGHLLQMLARRHPDFHAYVLPGNSPGASIGCFKAFPERPDGLPDLVLLGGDRNIDSFSPQYNAQSPVLTSTAALSLTDRSVTESEADPDRIALLGQNPAFPRDAPPATQRLRPRYGDRVDIAQATQASTTQSSFAYRATGRVLGECYTGVLRPYRVITVRSSDQLLSGDYQIIQVTHTLTRSNYAQTFTLRRNARSEPPAANNNAGLPGAIAASATVSFNVQGSIF